MTSFINNILSTVRPLLYMNVYMSLLWNYNTTLRRTKEDQIINIKQIRTFTRQLSRIYSLIIINVMVMGTGLALNYFKFNHIKTLYVAVVLNVIALIFFQPWKLAKGIRELYACQSMLEEVTKIKVVKGV